MHNVGIGGGRLVRLWGVGAAVTIAAVATAGCSGSASSKAAGIPAASRAQVLATRTYLTGPGHGLIELDNIAGGLMDHHTPATCRADRIELTRLAAGHTSGMVADPGLAELFGDEMSEMSSMLGRCRSGSVSGTALNALDRVHGTLDRRLQGDKVSR